MHLNVIIPAYNEADVIAENIKVIYDELKTGDFTFKIILVDDGSKDMTWMEIIKLSEKYSNIQAVRLARNFGKEMAICAGIDCVEEGITLVMDVDLQHPPKHIKSMIQLMNETSADIVEGIKNKRSKESALYRLAAASFYKIFEVVSGMKMDNSTDFKLMNYKVVSNLKRFGESNLFFRGIVDWCGFHKETYSFDVEERTKGSSRFSIFKLIRLSFDAVVSHTSKPLYLTTLIGTGFLVFAVILAIQSLYNYFMGYALSGFSTVILITLIASSLIMISLGIIGLYISRIYDEVKQRPRYVISNKIDSEKGVDYDKKD